MVDKVKEEAPSKTPNETELEVITETPLDSEDELVAEKVPFYRKWKRATVLQYTGLVTLGFGVMGIGFLILWWGTTDGWLFDFFRWLKAAGIKGCLIVALIMIPTNFPFIIGYAIITLASGFLFGFWWGLFTVVVGAQLGILAVNLLVRNLLRERTEQWIEKSGGRYANAIMKEIAVNRAKFCFLLRLLPIPIGLQNCMLSVSPIPLWMYQLCSGAGLLIKQIPEVYVGTTLDDVADIIQGNGDFNPAELIPIIIGFVAVLIFGVMILVFSRKVMSRLKEMEEEELDAVAEEVEDGLVSVELEEDSAPASPNASTPVLASNSKEPPTETQKETDVVEVELDKIESENDVPLSTMHTVETEWKEVGSSKIIEEQNEEYHEHEEDIHMTPLPLEN